MKLKVKNWEDFQHYKDRAPPWIKLHKHLLDNYEFHCLPVASRALAPCLWLIASEDLGGVIDASVEKIAFRLRQTPKEIIAALTPLIEKDFFLLLQDASNELAGCKQSSILETETETETDSEKKVRLGLPEWVPLTEWNDWIASRKTKPTARAKALAVKELQKLREDGSDPKAVLEQSILRGYTGLFPVNGANKSQPVQVDA